VLPAATPSTVSCSSLAASTRSQPAIAPFASRGGTAGVGGRAEATGAGRERADTPPRPAVATAPATAFGAGEFGAADERLNDVADEVEGGAFRDSRAAAIEREADGATPRCAWALASGVFTGSDGARRPEAGPAAAALGAGGLPVLSGAVPRLAVTDTGVPGDGVARRHNSYATPPIATRTRTPAATSGR